MEVWAAGLAILSIAAIVVPAVRLGIGPLPSTKSAQSVVIELIQRTPQDLPVYEFGSGWGGLTRRIAKARPNGKVTGVEASFVPFAVGAMRAYFQSTARPDMRYSRFERMHIKEPSIVVCYLHPEAMEMLAKWVVGKPVHYVVTVNFRLPGYEPVLRVGEGVLTDGPVYLYRLSKDQERQDERTI